jgi:outer membrane receptor protein involved in Fe transport
VSRRAWLLLTGMIISGVLGAQAVAPVSLEETGDSSPPVKVETSARSAPAKPAEKVDDEIVELSPFVVQAGDDDGYQAANTTSGSRLNTSLKDTPASISPFTEEFLSDVGATSVEDMLAYTGNSEGEFEDGSGFNDSASRWANTTSGRFRIRGMSGSSSRDFVNSSIPNDTYNIDRAEVASGPNSILFGLGSQGGTVLLSSKRANTRRNTFRVKNIMGTWDGFSTLPYERLEADANLVLIPRKLAFRLMALYQNSGSWMRYWVNDQKRISPALTIKPSKNTTIHLNYERGVVDGSTRLNWPAYDSVSGWLAAGRPLVSSLTAPVLGAAPAGMVLLAPDNNNVDHYVFNENDGTVNNYRQAYAGASLHPDSNNTVLASPSLLSYRVSTLGPGSQRNQTFESWSAIVDQRVGAFDFELGYYHNHNDSQVLTASGADGRSSGLTADPNVYISMPVWSSPSDKVPNPRAGQLYMEEQWYKNTFDDTNNVIRLTISSDIQPGKAWGRHRLMGLVEHAKNESVFIQKNEIWADDNNVVINYNPNSPTPEGNQNSVWRRRYITEGDFNTYYAGDGRIPTPTFVAGDKTYHGTFVTRKNASYHTTQETSSYALAIQSYWFKNRLITTLGARIDNLKFTNEKQARILDPNDPRILSGDKVLGEMAFSGEYKKDKYKPSTYAAGAVWHLSKHFSLFGNYSTNIGPPRFDRNVLPYGDIAQAPKGKTTEEGILVDFLGNDKIFLRITRFDTRQLGDNPIIPGSTDAINSAPLGNTDVITISTALHDAGLITDEQYQWEAVDFSFNSACLNTYTKGWEFSLIANPTKRITFSAAASYSDRNRYDVFSEGFAYFGQKFPEWFALANAMPESEQKQTLLDLLNDEKVIVDGKLQSIVNNNSGQMGSRMWKVVINTRYRFPDNFLKGFAIGGAMRYQSGPVIAWNNTTKQKTIGQQTLFFDAFITYRRKILRGKSGMTIQLNIRNLTNSDTVTMGRLASGADDGDTHRVYLNEPRNIRLTTTFDF